jgi:replicative superfamily II helicase
MAGRAGRPGYDVEGRVIVLTQDTTVEYYKNILACKKPIESSLHKSLIEHLNSEIVLNTIKDVPSVLDWAQSTLLWVRAKRRPSYYFPNAVSKQDDEGTAAAKVVCVCLCMCICECVYI